MLSEQMTAVIEMLKTNKESSKMPTPAEAIATVRKGNDEMLAALPPVEGMGTQVKEIGGQSGEYYTYEDEAAKQSDHFLLYIHGGGFENGTVASRRWGAQMIAKEAGMDCFSVEYVQWPEGYYPEGLINCLNAYRGVLEMGYRPENIRVAGESAGATLTLQLTKFLRDHEHGEQVPGKIGLIGPVMDFSLSANQHYSSRVEREDRDPMLYGHSVGDNLRYFSDDDRESPYVALWKNDFTGFPEAIITVATEEILYDDANDLHEKLDKAGVKNTLKIYEGLFHTFQLMPVPESVEAIKEIGQFLR